MGNYYFLTSFLEPQDYNLPGVHTVAEIDNLLSLNISEEDYRYYVVIKRFFDLDNFAFYWNRKQIQYSFGEVFLSNIERILKYQQWEDGGTLDEFFLDYLTKYVTDEERLLNFSELKSSFLNFYKDHKHPFIREYFSFQRSFRLVLAGFRAHMNKLDLSYVLRNEDNDDPLVIDILMQKNSLEYDLPVDFSDLKIILSDYGRLPNTLYKALSWYEFQRVEDLYKNSYFDSQFILGRATSYLLAIKNNLRDEESGKKLLKEIEQEITW